MVWGLPWWVLCACVSAVQRWEGSLWIYLFVGFFFFFGDVVHFRGVDGMVWDDVELKRQKKFGGSDKLIGMCLSWP